MWKHKTQDFCGYLLILVKSKEVTTTLSLLQQFSHPVSWHYLLENVVNGTTLVDFEGPWCDISSLGMLLLRICLGENTEEDKCDVSEEGERGGLR